jgi:dynein heavy chain 1
MKPWFDAFVGTRSAGRDGDIKMGVLNVSLNILELIYRTGIPVTKKKFLELELSLLHL